ncbi:Sugar phosphate isomerase/epimerase [Streptomyces sp. SolWspMP-sol7th]|uniref:sugar phosphate isomerase/epimerase family protein n=1 Tax=Streptomyces sp. SolWspMP-sol7th TaxID=1839776 RepID=UPI00081F0961|nr:sugar phosphate isomerase/epimerase [Streptomyces sp. SolWspMP-sol7th]SCE33232.1 Sugar phosphate isomerase/epimerase [Streptomyces sp. SolWspMP-sol7th]
MSYELTLSAQTLRAVPFGTRVGAAAEAGFRGLGLSVEQYRDALEAGWTDGRMVDLLAARGLRVTEIELLTAWGGGAGRGAREDDAVAERLVELFRPERVHATVFAARPLDELAAGFAGVCRKAAASGARAALEFLPYAGIPTIGAAWEVVAAAGDANGGILVDCWHWARSGATAADLAPVPAERIIAVQLADALRTPLRDPRYEARHHRLLPGEGGGHVAGMLDTLRAHGVRASLAAEVVSDMLDVQDPRLTARQVHRACVGVLEEACFPGLPVDGVRSPAPAAGDQAPTGLPLPSRTAAPGCPEPSETAPGCREPRETALPATRHPDTAGPARPNPWDSPPEQHGPRSPARASAPPHSPAYPCATPWAPPAVGRSSPSRLSALRGPRRGGPPCTLRDRPPGCSSRCARPRRRTACCGCAIPVGACGARRAGKR